MLVSLLMNGRSYDAHRIYRVPAPLAAQLVRERVARLVRATATRPVTGWRATLRDGDAFEWQVTIELPNLIKPRILRRYQAALVPPQTRRQRRHLDEVGGDGRRLSPCQAMAIEYLLQHEAKLYHLLLIALADYAARCRTAWDLDDRVAPNKISAAQVSQRVEVLKVYISRRSRDGTAYIEFRGECAWDREHGFTVVMHRQRIVAVTQQGAGWSDRRPPKRRAV